MDMVALRTYCRQRIAQGQAELLIESRLDVSEQQSERLQRSEQRVAKLLQTAYGSKRERVSAGQLQLALVALPPSESVAELSAGLQGPKPQRRPRRKSVRTPRQIPQTIERRTVLSDPTAPNRPDCEHPRTRLSTRKAGPGNPATQPRGGDAML